MWPSRVGKSDFLLKIYGHYPSLDGVEVTELVLSREGPSISLSLLAPTLPYNPPADWKPFNQVFLGLRFVSIDAVEITKLSVDGRSNIRMWDQGSCIRAQCAGAAEFDVHFQHLMIDRISGVLSEGPER
jgi:hypothetical protein